jgi:flagellar biogenesis protein FliO
MTSDQITAFKSAVGGPAGGYLPGNFALLLALIGAAALLLWGAYIVMKLGEEFLSGRITASKLFAYKVRVLVLIFLVVAILNA